MLGFRAGDNDKHDTEYCSVQPANERLSHTATLLLWLMCYVRCLPCVLPGFLQSGALAFAGVPAACYALLTRRIAMRAVVVCIFVVLMSLDGTFNPISLSKNKQRTVRIRHVHAQPRLHVSLQEAGSRYTT
jgi:hypothetical protein